jgi:hypothetical protein
MMKFLKWVHIMEIFVQRPNRGTGNISGAMEMCGTETKGIENVNGAFRNLNHNIFIYNILVLEYLNGIQVSLRTDLDTLSASWTCPIRTNKKV